MENQTPRIAVAIRYKKAFREWLESLPWANNIPAHMWISSGRVIGEQVKETIWFRITTWGKQAEICSQYVRKGAKVLIEGRLTPDKATGGPRIFNKQDGSVGAAFEVTAGTVRFLSSRGEGAGGPGIEGVEIPGIEEPIN